MLLFIMLNKTPFYVEERMSQLCPEQPHVLSQCTPHWGALGHFFSDSLNCKYLQMYSRTTGIREPQM